MIRLEEEISLQPNTLVLSKAISDDSLWNRILGQAPEELKRDLSQAKLLSEYPNPVYETLVQTRADNRIAQHRLLASKTHLAEELERARHQIAELDGQVVGSQIQLVQLLADREVALKRIQFDREAGLEQLGNGRKAEYQVLQLTRQQQVEALEQRMQYERAGLERQNKIAASTLDELSKRLVSAQILAASSDLQIASSAEEPDQPVEPSLVLNAVLGALVGFLASLTLAFSLNSWQAFRPQLVS